MSRQEPFTLQLRKLELEVIHLKQRIILLESIIDFVLPLISPSSGKDIVSLREFKELLRINRGLK